MATKQENVPGRLAGIDFGTVRIGVALTDPERRWVNPFANYTRRDIAADAAWFRSWRPMNGSCGSSSGCRCISTAAKARNRSRPEQFGAWLAETTGVPVVFFDERFTSSEAEQLLAEAKMTKKRRKARLDKLAAHILLTAYLEAGQPETQEPKGLDQ